MSSVQKSAESKPKLSKKAQKAAKKEEKEKDVLVKEDKKEFNKLVGIEVRARASF